MNYYVTLFGRKRNTVSQETFIINLQNFPGVHTCIYGNCAQYAYQKKNTHTHTHTHARAHKGKITPVHAMKHIKGAEV